MKYGFKLISSLIIFLVPLTFAQGSNELTKVNKPYKIRADSIAPDHSGISELTSAEFAKDMAPGWNVGNSLEAIGGETAWGNPKITQKLIDSIKAAGFNSVRIPVAWRKYSDSKSFTIKTDWLDRVEEVVNYVLNNGMYAIINEHWDGGWIIPTYEKQDTVNKELFTMWQQIAVRFRDYDDHLLFAGTNEIMYPGDYGTPRKEYYTVQNGFNQTFVNAVRSTGGRNYYRYLLVQGFNTNINFTNSYFTMPADVAEQRLMVEVHYYDPYNFTINENTTITQWGKWATDSKKTETWANESYADGQFNKMKTKFIDKGYAVVLGEYGVLSRLKLGSQDQNDEFARFRQYYMYYVTNSMFKHGLIPVYWDNGGTGNNGMGIFIRSTGAQAYPDIVKAIINACDTNYTTGMLNNDELPSKFSLMQNYPNPFNPETTIRFSVPVETRHPANAGQVATSLRYASLKIYDLLGREVATLVDGMIVPGNYKVTFDGSRLTSGIYFYSLFADNYSSTKKMLLIK